MYFVVGNVYLIMLPLANLLHFPWSNLRQLLLESIHKSQLIGCELYAEVAKD